MSLSQQQLIPHRLQHRHGVTASHHRLAASYLPPRYQLLLLDQSIHATMSRYLEEDLLDLINDQLKQLSQESVRFTFCGDEVPMLNLAISRVRPWKATATRENARQQCKECTRDKGLSGCFDCLLLDDGGGQPRYVRRWYLPR